MSTMNPATTKYSRVFITEGGARPDHLPSYHSCMKATGIDMPLGDITKIECPDPNGYGFVERGVIQGETGRPTTSLVGRYAKNLKSELLRIAKKRCSADIQIHFGECQDPSIFGTFQKAIILEDAYFTSYSTEDLGALGSDENAKIDETGEISARNIYEIVPLSVSKRADDIVTDQVLCVTVCDYASCGDCDEESDGCEKIYAGTSSATGSPGSPPDVLYSLDKGSTWDSDAILSAEAGDDAAGIACLDGNVIVISYVGDELHYKAQATIDAGTAGGWTAVATGIVAAGSPTAIVGVSKYIFICGDGGYVYGSDDPTAGVDVLDAGVATTDDLNAIDALDEDFAVAGGDDGALVYTTNGITWVAATTSPVTAGTDITAVLLLSEKVWLVGTSAGTVYYTIDGAVTWTQSALPSSGWTAINDIVKSTSSVLYLSATKATPAGYMLRSYDGGHSWVVLPESVGNIPANDEITALAACAEDPDFVVGVGLADDGTDGIIVVGRGS